MPTVRSSTVISAPIAHVYSVARDIERFPEFMPNMVEVEIIEQTPTRQVSRWVGLIKEFNRKIRWVEEDLWDEERRVCDFRQIEGDYSEFGGRWEFRELSPDTTEASMTIDYEYDVPMIGSLIKGIILKKTQQNIDSMLAGLKGRSEQTWAAAGA